MEQIQIQLADHYDYAAELNAHIDECSSMTHALSDNHLALLARQQSLEQEMLEGFRSGEEATNCVRYGLMEFGGFTRFASLTGEQIRHMMTQERGNFVLWNMKNRTENTDPIEEVSEHREQAEEESPTSDPETDGNDGGGSPSRIGEASAQHAVRSECCAGQRDVARCKRDTACNSGRIGSFIDFSWIDYRDSEQNQECVPTVIPLSQEQRQ